MNMSIPHAGDRERPLLIELGSPWEKGYIESFNGKLRDEPVDRELFHTVKEAQILIECWRQHYNTVRPHSALGYRAPGSLGAVSPHAHPAAASGAGIRSQYELTCLVDQTMGAEHLGLEKLCQHPHRRRLVGEAI